MDKQKRAIGLLSAAVCVMCIMISLGFIVTSVGAQGVNVGFETGNFSGWTVSIPTDGAAQVRTSHTTGLASEYLPVKGTYFAFLEPGVAGNYTSLTQALELAAGETICGHAAFDAAEDPEGWHNDNASVRILNSTGNEIAMPWYADVAMIGASGDGPWTYWEWTAPASGTYILELRVTNADDEFMDSYALFDNGETTPVSLGFETGNFSGWTVDTGIDGVAEIITSHTTGLATTYLPVEGTYFARLEPSYYAGVPTTLNQSLDLAAGETICGHAAFDAQELPEDPDNDSAWVRILDSTGNEIAMPWYADVAMIGASGDGPWTYWEWTAPASGTYNVQFGVTNYLYDGMNSVALFDGGEAAPSIELTPASHNFGTVQQGQCSSEYSFNLTNTGGGTATGSVALTGTQANQFTITSGGGSFSLGAGQLKTIKVRFCPTSTGSKTAALNTVGTNCNDNSSTLSGIGADGTAPAAITNLATANPTSSTIDLSWTAPGDDNNTGTATSYDIRYRIGGAITNVSWATATQVTGEPAPKPAGSSETFTVTGLSPSTTYYFAIKTRDEVPNISPISNSPSGTTTAAADGTAPAAITNLATANPTSSSIPLSWTAPGDDGTTGTATTYDIRYRTGGAITEANWATATQAVGEPTPKAAGSSETFTVTGLSPSTTYYFAIKTADEVPNISPISNSPSRTTLPAADEEPPVISNVTSSAITMTTATITWNTNEIADSLVKYGTTSGAYTIQQYNAADVTSHSVLLTGLTPSTTYYYVVNSTDPSGNPAQSAEFFFATQALSVHNVNSGKNFSTIQAAINDAATLNGHTILVDSGTYHERVSVTKRLILRGNDTGGGKPVVDAGGMGNAITLSHAGIVLDGFTAINASSYPMTGILVYSNNNTIINNSASNNNYGIHLSSSSNNMVINSTTSNNSYGIYLHSSSTNSLTGNIASDNSDYGIYLYSSSTNSLTGNTVSNNTNYGIRLYSSSTNSLTGNIASNNSDGISLSSSSNNNTLTGNTASNNSYGIVLHSSSTNTLTGNAANSNNQYGIRLHSSSNTNTLTDNSALNNQYGISLGSSSTNTLTDNTANSNNQYGIYLHSSSKTNTLTGNAANSNNQYGIYLGSSSTNTLTGNTALSNQYGIYLGSSSTNTLTDNTVLNNQYGIYLGSSSNSNTLTDNIASNNLVGIFLYSSSTNHIYNNYFNNTINAHDGGANIWNITPTPGLNIIGGSWLGGNYWSDYTGNDISGDGLGDTKLPYNSSGYIVNGGDWLPLVTPGPDTTPPAAITNLATANPTSSSIQLSWTAPGDDGATGTATAYDIRYRTGGAIIDANWASATPVIGEPAPKPAGSSESFTVTGLSPGTTYYFAIKTADEVPIWSPISNSPSGTTTAAALPSIELAPTNYNFGTFQLGQCSSEYSFTVTNTGSGTATGSVFLTGTQADQFTITSGGGSFSLGAGQSKTIKVKFCPTSAGSKSATLYANGTNCNDGSSTLSGIGVDGTPPAAITNLATANPTNSSIQLSWTAPGDDNNTGTATTYDIRYRTGGAIAEANWASATQVIGEPAPKPSGSSESFTVTGLSSSTTYYFAIKTADEVPNWSPISNSPSGTTSDIIAPAAITNLATANPTSSSIQLSWTAPGDDNNTGTATSYDIRYRTGGAITEANWATATQVTGETSPKAAGSSESFTVTGLSPSTAYYFAIKTADEVPNISPISNSPSGTTLEKQLFDTGASANPYPSISGTHNGTITPSHTLTITELYTYPCSGTDGHTEYAAISYPNGTVLAEAHWDGYLGDWHNITFNNSFTLYANETYKYTIVTGSYPQIIHESSWNATGGVITCSEFVDINGKRHEGWIPAIRLY